MKFYCISFTPYGTQPRCGFDALIHDCRGFRIISGPGYKTLKNARNVIRTLNKANPTYFQELKIHKVVVEEIT